MADDQWMFFPCEMGEHRAFIFFDNGVRDTISEAPNRLVKLRARFKHPSEAGLPPNAEYETLSGLENEIVKFVGLHKGWFVGRISVNGHRHFYCYVDIADDRIASFAEQAEKRFGHVLDFESRDDPAKAGYLEELYPTDRDWQVMKDSQAIDLLEKRGDPLTAERRIDHWVYFSDPSARDTAAPRDGRPTRRTAGRRLVQSSVRAQNPRAPRRELRWLANQRRDGLNVVAHQVQHQAELR